MDHGINIIPFKEAMEGIEKTITRQEGLIRKLDDGESFIKDLTNLREKSGEKTFKLLVMGVFNSGKSSFINVLLGEKVLPEGMLPATALITEIKYGEKSKVIIYPKPGKWSGGNAPFEIKPADMAKYCLINSSFNTKEGNTIDTPFKKMEVFWKLPLLKDGVVIVDSPGLDDPFSHDYIAQDYIPKSDAIIYCISGVLPFSARDRKELESLNTLGFKTPIIVTTRFDNVRDSSTVPELQEYIRQLNGNYIEYTKLGDKGCHYVDSKEGLKGKQSENGHSMLVNSGYFELENFLSVYLTENKGKDQISAITKLVSNLNKKAISRATAKLNTADEPMHEFEKRLADASKKLDDARKQGDLLVREFKMANRDIAISVKPLVEEMVNSLADQIDMDDYEPSSPFKITRPRESATAITEECCDEIKRRNETYIAKWSNETLMPLLSEKVKDVAKRMEGSFNRFAEDIQKVEIILTQDNSRPEIPTGPGTGSRVASFAFALLTGDIVTGLIGGTLGIGALGRALAYQFLAGIILGVVALFTPIGLPALIIAAIIANIAALLRQGSVAGKSINKNVANKYKEHFNKPETKAELIESVQSEIAKQIGKLSDNLKSAIDGDISDKEDDIAKIIDEKQNAQGDVNAKKAGWTELINKFEEIDREMETVRRGFRIIS